MLPLNRIKSGLTVAPRRAAALSAPRKTRLEEFIICLGDSRRDRLSYVIVPGRVSPLLERHAAILGRRTGMWFALLLAIFTPVFAQVSVTTYQYDNTRAGTNSNETILTPSNVNVTQFGQLFSDPIDGQAYAQPLYLPNVSISGATHNVVFIAT